MAFLEDPLLVWATLLACAIAAAGLAWACLRLFSKLASKTEGEFDDQLAKGTHAPLSAFIGLVAAGALFVGVAGRLSAVELAWTRRTMLALFLVVTAWISVRLARLFLEAAARREGRYVPASRVARRLLAVVVYAGVFLLVLDQYGIAITPLLTGLGIAGLAAALALQDTLGNFFAGISIQTGKALQPGHYVRVEGDALEGYVEDIGWRTTTIRTLGGNTVVIPNAEIAKSRITDFYLPKPDMSVVMEFLVGQEADPKRVIEILVEEAKAAQKTNEGMAPNEPFAQYAGIQEYALKFSLIIRVTEFVQQYQVQHDVGQRILQRFRKEGIRIPFPTRHNYQEPVSPEARRVPGAPGGLSPRTRPKPRAREKEQVADPRQQEAQQARQEIAALQAKKGKGT